MVRDGLLGRAPIPCAVCGRTIDPGQAALCNDGYERVYGEFVLSEQDDQHEDNWPESHAACAADDD